MRRDILRSYPARRSGSGARRAQRHRPRALAPRRRPGPRARRSASTPTARSVVFVGRITRQKGLPYLLRAAALLPPDVQLVLCAGAPDTPEILAEVQSGVRRPAGGALRRGLDRPAAQPARALGRAVRRDHLRLPVGLRAARHRQPRGDGLRRARRRRPRPAASPRSSTTASPADWCRSSRSTTARERPLDPDRFVADLAAALTEVVADPAPPRRWARPADARRGATSAGRASPRRDRGAIYDGRCSTVAARVGWTSWPAFSQLSDVSVVRDGNRILDSVTWTVDADQRWVVLGPNGAGKTTLLQVASARCIRPSGTAEMLGERARQGRRLRAAPADRLRVDGDGPPRARATRRCSTSS